MNRRERIIWNTLWLSFGAFLVGMILAAPVMREPSHTMTATEYFGNAN